jgi:hypothetical protein
MNKTVNGLNPKHVVKQLIFCLKKRIRPFHTQYYFRKVNNFLFNKHVPTIHRVNEM